MPLEFICPRCEAVVKRFKRKLGGAKALLSKPMKCPRCGLILVLDPDNMEPEIYRLNAEE